MKTRARSFLLIALTSLSVAACDKLVRAPNVRLVGIGVRGIGLSGATLLARLAIDNPNKFTIATDSIAFEFYVASQEQPGEWKRVTKGVSAERIKVGGGSSTTVEIPIDFAYADLGVPVRALLEKGTFDYRLSGVIYVRRPLKRLVPFRQEGSLSLGGSYNTR